MSSLRLLSLNPSEPLVPLRLVPGRLVTCSLTSKFGDKTDRYSIQILDTREVEIVYPCAVLIIPRIKGREIEYAFASENGKIKLSKGVQRMIFVTMNRGHVFQSLEAVKKELDPFIMQLTQKSNMKIPYLTPANDIGMRKEIYTTTSELSGEIVVEEVQGEEQAEVLRRMIFSSHKGLIQSEARIVNGKLDFSYLACGYMKAIVLAFGLSVDLFRESVSSSVLVIGLGGGLLPMFIHKAYPQIKLECVELDPTIVEIAKKCFDCDISDSVNDQKISVHVADGLDFVANASVTDVIILDIDSKDVTAGLSCPPQIFLERNFLECVCSKLSDAGMFILNLVCRDDAITAKVVETLRSIFNQVYKISVNEDVNIVLVCFRNSSNLLFNQENWTSAAMKARDYMQFEMKEKWDVTSELESCKFSAS